MASPLGYLKETASQTAGPYVHIGLIPHQAGFEIFQNSFGPVMAGAAVAGERVRVEGRVFDGGGEPVRDVLVEVWQADARGRYRHPADAGADFSDGFRGWGRAGSAFDTGLWWVETIKPGRVPGRDGRLQAPHLSLWLVARGINIGLQTRMYFADEPEANAADPVLALVDPPSRRATLVSRREVRDSTTVHVFDIRLQGDGETVFFDI